MFSDLKKVASTSPIKEPRKSADVKPNQAVQKKGKKRTHKEVGEMEKSVLESYGLEKSDFEVPKMPRLGSHGLRRALRFQVWDASAKATDEGVLAEFSINKGSYATAVLREVMKKDVV